MGEWRYLSFVRTHQIYRKAVNGVPEKRNVFRGVFANRFERFAGTVTANKQQKPLIV